VDTIPATAAELGQSLEQSIDDYRLSLHASGRSKATRSVSARRTRNRSPASGHKGEGHAPAMLG
jgi:hypothetical protein